KNLAAGKTEKDELERLSKLTKSLNDSISPLDDNIKIMMATRLREGKMDRLLNAGDKASPEFQFGDLHTKPLKPVPILEQETKGKTGFRVDEETKRVADLAAPRQFEATATAHRRPAANLSA